MLWGRSSQQLEGKEHRALQGRSGGATPALFDLREIGPDLLLFDGEEMRKLCGAGLHQSSRNWGGRATW